MIQQVKVYVYFGLGGLRHYIFLVGPYHESFARIKGRKRIRLEQLFKKTKLEKRDLNSEYQKPDKEYMFYVCNRSLGV
jgi:hypothetical protein